MRQVLTGEDGSASAPAAVRWAEAVAAAASAESEIAHAWEPSFVEVPPDAHQELRAPARHTLESDD